MRSAVLVLAVTMLYGNGSAFAADCPTQAEAQTALTKYINVQFWSPGQRDIWKIKSVSAFTFTPMRVGKIVKKQVEYGKLAEDVCPVRLTYSFTTEKADGRKEVTTMGENKTHLFYKDPFDDWTFKVE
jgi:hypothetical protein